MGSHQAQLSLKTNGGAASDLGVGAWPSAVSATGQGQAGKGPPDGTAVPPLPLAGSGTRRAGVTDPIPGMPSYASPSSSLALGPPPRAMSGFPPVCLMCSTELPQAWLRKATRRATLLCPGVQPQSGPALPLTPAAATPPPSLVWTEHGAHGCFGCLG